MPLSPRRSLRWPSATATRRGAILVAALFSSLAAAPRTSAAQLRRTLPDSLTDREFWQFFVTMSEEGGSFSSENFVSNEQTFQHVVPTLQRSLTPGGVYLGVGPEQNFTYIANLEPRLAVIFDIRRQNAMAHLMYKALFELSATRAEFVSRLFSRPLPASLAGSAAPAELFAAATTARASDSAFDANWRAIVERLTIKHGFALADDDIRSMRHVYTAFFEAGPDINYAYRLGGSTFGPRYVTFAELQGLTNADGVNMAFLASDASYQRLRLMETRNLIVPVVGDFAGPKAIRGVGAYLRERGAAVTAFYLSNVEQYLFRGFGDAAERFYKNVETLPVDSTSTFIRSVPPTGGYGGVTFVGGSLAFTGTTNSYSVQMVDSGGVRIITTISDSAGQRITSRAIDSTGTQSPLAVFRSLQARDDSLKRAAAGPRPPVLGTGGTLISGIASIRASLAAFTAGKLATYQDAIAMTKTEGWKQSP